MIIHVTKEDRVLPISVSPAKGAAMGLRIAGLFATFMVMGHEAGGNDDSIWNDGKEQRFHELQHKKSQGTLTQQEKNELNDLYRHWLWYTKGGREGENLVKFTPNAANDLVVGLKKSHGGNVTVMKDGKPVFRVHQPGTHGNTDATITRFKQGTNPNNGRTFNIPDKKVSAFDEDTFTILNRASKGQDGYSIVTKGVR